MADWGKILESAGYGVKATGSIVGNIISANVARKARRRVNRQLNAQEERANREFESQYYADPRQLASNQLMLSEMQKYLQEQRQARAASNAVTGGTEESVAAAKAIDNQTVADTTAKMAASNETRRAAIRDQYNETMTGLSNARISQIQNDAVKNNVYNLQGVKVAGDLQSGLYIKNGKKIVKK